MKFDLYASGVILLPLLWGRTSRSCFHSQESGLHIQVYEVRWEEIREGTLSVLGCQVTSGLLRMPTLVSMLTVKHLITCLTHNWPFVLGDNDIQGYMDNQEATWNKGILGFLFQPLKRKWLTVTEGPMTTPPLHDRQVQHVALALWLSPTTLLIYTIIKS